MTSANAQITGGAISGTSVNLSGQTLSLADNQLSGDKIHGGTISNFASIGIDDNADQTVLTIGTDEVATFAGGVTVNGALTTTVGATLGNQTKFGVLDVNPDGQVYPNINFNGDLSGTDSFTTIQTDISGAGNTAYVGDMDLGFNRRASDGTNLGYHAMWRNGMIDQVFTRKLTALANTKVIEVRGDLVPEADNTRSLGSATKMWKDVHIGPGTLFIDGHPILSSADSNTINITTDTGQSLDILAGGGSGTAGVINMASRGNVTTFNDTTVNLGPSGASGTINARGTLEAPDLHVGDLEFSANKIDSTASDGNLEIATDGTGYVHLNAADVYVGPVNGAVKIDESSISVTNTNGNLNLTPNGSGAVKVGTLALTTNTIAQAAGAPINMSTSGGGGHFNLATDDALYLGNQSAFMTIKPTLIASTNATLAITGNLTGNVAGNVAGNVDAPATVSVGSLDITTNNITQSTANQPVNITTSGSNAFINVTAPAIYLGTGETNFITITPSKISTNTSGSTRLEIEAGHIAANPSNRTFPAIANWGPYDIQASIGNGVFTQADHGVGYPIFAVSRTDAVGESQATAAYFVNRFDYDHHNQAGSMTGHGTEVRFAAQDQAGNLHEIGSNLVKMRSTACGGSAGSSTVTGYDGEYTLTLGKFNDSAINALTVNKDFTQATNEIRVTNTLRGSGSASLSGLYLTNNTPSGNAQTGTPTAKIQLRNEGSSTTTSLIELAEAKITLKKVTKLAPHTTTAQNALTAASGDILFNTTTSKFMGYNGSAWVELG